MDIISNEPLTGRQTLLGRVRVEGGEVQIEAKVPDQLEDTLRRIVSDIDPDHDPEGFVSALPERVDYTYMIASVLHETDDCAFDEIGGEPVRDQPTESEQFAWHGAEAEGHTA